MARQYRYVIHEAGPALWPEHKPLAEVLELKATTMPNVWETTYQGNPTPPGGTVFERGWWAGKNRFRAGESSHVHGCIARWISFDTAEKDGPNNAFTAAVVGELWPDYRLAIREVFRERLTFPALPLAVRSLAGRYVQDGKLRQVLIEDKSSGTSAFQTLMASSEDWLKPFLFAFQPSGDKVTRAQQAAVWAHNDCVLLPEPDEYAPWLLDFENEVFDFPNSAFMDQVDALSQLVIFVENLLAEGWRARGGAYVVSKPGG